MDTSKCDHELLGAPRKVLEHLAVGCPRALPGVAAWAERLLTTRDWGTRIGLIAADR